METRTMSVGTRPVSWARGLELGLAVTAALIITNLGLPQWATGALVNALLLTVVLRLGVSQAIVVGMITPLGAAVRGVLPLPLLVMIPFIALGNATLVAVFGALQARNRWVALGLGAAAKFALLYAAVTLLVVRPLTLAMGGDAQVVTIPQAMVAMMQWPQLATALTGGLVALGADALIRRRA